MFDSKMVVEFLESAEEGCFVENEETGYRAEVTNMCGGRYLVFDKDNEIVAQTDIAGLVCEYLM